MQSKGDGIYSSNDRSDMIHKGDFTGMFCTLDRKSLVRLQVLIALMMEAVGLYISKTSVNFY
jgi:hypothetical protein